MTKVLSPGTIVNDSNLDFEGKNFIYFISIENDKIFIFIFEYITFTIEFINFKIDEFFKEQLLNLFSKRKVKEIFIFENKIEYDEIKKILSEYFSEIQIKEINFDFEFDKNLKLDWIKKYKIEKLYENCLILFLKYLTKFQFLNLSSDATFISYQKNKHLFFDLSTQKHLEIIENNFDGTVKNTLFSVLNKTKTAMGSRLLKYWLIHPLQNINEIELRQKCVKDFLMNWHISKNISNLLYEIGDLERLSGRINLKRSNYKDYQKLIQVLPLIERVKTYFSYFEKNELFEKINFDLWFDSNLLNYLKERIFLENINNHSENLIKYDSDEILRNLYSCMNSQNEIILNFEKEENRKIGVENYLKVKNTPLYGYVFEISKIKDQEVVLPNDYLCIQTLSQKERYTTPRLKKLENDFLNAQENYKKREKELYLELEEKVYELREKLIKNAKSLSELDVLIGLAFVAQEKNWACPLINENDELNIIEGKHPVVDLLSSNFVENSLYLSEKKSKSWIITGPNMGGKSTFMRQNALIIIL